MILWVMQHRALMEFGRRAALPLLCLLIIIYFGVHALFGPSGYFALDDIRHDRARFEARHHQLEQRKAALQRDIILLNPRGADPDFADELVRRHLGVIRPDELVVPLPKVEAPHSPADIRS